MTPALIAISGLGILILFIVCIFLSLESHVLRFLKYFLIYILFLASIGALFFIFERSVVFVALLAGLGWAFLIIRGARNPHHDTPNADDSP